MPATWEYRISYLYPRNLLRCPVQTPKLCGISCVVGWWWQNAACSRDSMACSMSSTNLRWLKACRGEMVWDREECKRLTCRPSSSRLPITGRQLPTESHRGQSDTLHNSFPHNSLVFPAAHCSCPHGKCQLRRTHRRPSCLER